ncbi:hypothetical protein H3H54_02875 [Brachybacterium sp. Z12]|nr:hypothetical protein [Brachybacterium sp. Z12]QNN82836.1 hypothetical protein H3H54_02875 [Brachybacterium sp. Z12]
MSPRTITAEDKSFPAGLVGRDVTVLEEPLASFSTPCWCSTAPQWRTTCR